MTTTTATITRRLTFPTFQTEQICRAAMHDGAILSWEPGLGKTIAGLAWALIKGAQRILVVAPGGLHKQWRDEAWDKFRTQVRDLPDARTFRAFALDRAAPAAAATQPRFYITSYQDLGYNGGDEWPDAVSDDGFRTARADRVKARMLDRDFIRIQQATARMLGKKFDPTPYFEGIGEEKTCNVELGVLNGELGKTQNSAFRIQHSHTIRCVWTATLSRTIAAAEGSGGGFDCVIVDEGTKLQGMETHIANGVCGLTPKMRLILTGTPIKNRLESFFRLGWWVCGGSPEPTARFPYEGTSEAREEFANQHLQHDRFLTREREAAGDHGGEHYVPADVFEVLQRARVGTL